MQKKSFIVTTAERDTSLIEILSSRLSISKKKAKQLLDQRSVFVNQRRVWMAKHTLRKGDSIEVTGIAPAMPHRKTILRVLFEDAHILIADKPTGMLANGPASAEIILRDQTGIATLTAAHRLDRDTSGCLIFAKTPKTAEQLIALFDAHSIKKTYQAIVLGEVARTLHAISRTLDGKSAMTRITCLRSNSTASHLQLAIETGRTHQIRKHLAGVGHPILGDRMYLTATLTNPVLRAVSRQMLHAAQVAFPHPVTQKPIHAHSPFPPDYQHCLRTLRLT